MLRVGLTGGIAAGKSRVLRRFAERGFATIDLDRVAHEMMAPGGASYDAIVAEFGHGVLRPDGHIDRAVLGARVFGESAQRARLDAIVHPLVRAEETRRAAAYAAAGAEVCVTDAALLVEAGLHLRFDRLVVVVCPPEVQLARLVRRDGLTEAAARARIDAQMPGEQKVRFGHHRIDSAGAPEHTDGEADAVAARLRALAAAPRVRVPLVQARVRGGLRYGPAEGPRGLAPADLLAAAASPSGLELAVLAGALRPPAAGPWYEACRATDSATPGPESLAVAVAAAGRTGGRGDDAHLGAVAYSIARLTHDGPFVADGCAAAFAAAVVLDTGAATDLEARWPALSAAAAQWAGALPRPGIAAAIRAARDAGGDPAAAAAAAVMAGGSPELAGALAGAVRGAEAEEIDGAARAAIARLAAG